MAQANLILFYSPVGELGGSWTVVPSVTEIDASKGGGWILSSVSSFCVRWLQSSSVVLALDSRTVARPYKVAVRWIRGSSVKHQKSLLGRTTARLKYNSSSAIQRLTIIPLHTVVHSTKANRCAFRFAGTIGT